MQQWGVQVSCQAFETVLHFPFKKHSQTKRTEILWLLIISGLTIPHIQLKLKISQGRPSTSIIFKILNKLEVETEVFFFLFDPSY